jgi:hypothetical protein
MFAIVAGAFAQGCMNEEGRTNRQAQIEAEFAKGGSPGRPSPKPSPLPSPSASPSPSPVPVTTTTSTSSSTSTSTTVAPAPSPSPTPTQSPVSGPSQSLLLGLAPANFGRSDGVGVNYELGMKFSSSASGQITAIRFYKDSQESGTHTGKIYSSSGALLASVAFSGESASGWQQQTLPAPLSIQMGVQYVVSVNTGNSFYVATNNGFDSARSVGNLSAPVGAGVFGSVGSMPNQVWSNSNYFRDIVFIGGLVQPSPTPSPVASPSPSPAISPIPSGHNAARANSYDDAWQDAWVANVKSIIARGVASGNAKKPGFLLWIGDSLSRGPAMGAWARGGAGKTPSDMMITQWMGASTAVGTIDSVDGFALASPYICSARSFTVGDGQGAWHFLGAGNMPADSNYTTAREKLLNCANYSNNISLETMLTAFPQAQFAITLVNLLASNPMDTTDLRRMMDLMISHNVVPIVTTHLYRTDANFNLLVDQYNVALKRLAENMKLPLIDLQAEMLARRPLSEWPGTYLSGDGVHQTNGANGYTGTSDPYLPGGDPATHTTGEAMRNNGYGIRGWLGVQKMKEIKALVSDQP